MSVDGIGLVRPAGAGPVISTQGVRIELKVLSIYSPPALEHYFEELAPLTAPGGPPDRAALAAVMARYDMVFDPPASS